ncbi:MAG: hypothetical protein RLZZ623_2791 [Actinomycetota bacterium]
MYTICWSPKGGTGTTVVSCGIALVSARSEPTIVIDLGGDVGSALGVAQPAGAGVGDWLASPRASGERLLALATPVTDALTLVHPGTLGLELTEVHHERLADACATSGTRIVIDAGPFMPTGAMHQCADASLLVVRPCYLALRRAAVLAHIATGVIVIHEPGRALTCADVERALGCPVIGEIPWDPGIARSVDAGLLASRLPASLARPLARASDGSRAA